MQNYITKIFKKSTENQAKTDYTHYTVPTTNLAVIFVDIIIDLSTVIVHMFSYCVHTVLHVRVHTPLRL